MKIEIYNKKTNKVIETKDLGDNPRSLRGFAAFFSMQCNTKKYGYREVNE